MLYQKILFILSLTIFSVSSVAASDQVPKDRTITEISVYDNTTVVHFTPGFVNTQCPPGSSTTEAHIDTSTTNILLTTTLAAAAQGKQVGFGFNGCVNGDPKIYRIDVKY